MLLHIELWKPRERWLAMAEEERAAFLGDLVPTTRMMMHAGIEIVGWGINDADTPHRADFTYFAVWRLPSRESLSMIEGMVESAGWHDYFEQVNVRGDMILPKVVVSHLIEAPDKRNARPTPNDSPAERHGRPDARADVRSLPRESASRIEIPAYARSRDP